MTASIPPLPFEPVAHGDSFFVFNERMSAKVEVLLDSEVRRASSIK